MEREDVAYFIGRIDDLVARVTVLELAIEELRRLPCVEHDWQELHDGKLLMCRRCSTILHRLGG